MRKVGFFILWPLCLALVGLAGCNGSAARIASLEAAVSYSEKALGFAEANITALQTQLAAAQAAGADSETLDVLQSALTEALAQKPGVEQFLSQARASLEKAKANPNASGEIELYVSMAVSALGIFASAWFKRKASQQAKTAKDRSVTLKTVVDAVDKTGGEAAENVKANVLALATTRHVFDMTDAIIDEHRASKQAAA